MNRRESFRAMLGLVLAPSAASAASAFIRTVPVVPVAVPLVSTALSAAETKMINEAVFQKLMAGDPALVKVTVDAVNDFTRTKMREDGFLRQILSPVSLTNDQLDRAVWTPKPSRWRRWWRRTWRWKS